MKFRTRSDKDRKISINWDRINIYASRWKPNTEFEVEIKRFQQTTLASKNQRAFYFGYVLPPFMDELGYDKEEGVLFHHQLKVTYFQHDPAFKIKQDTRGIWRGVPSVFSLDPDMGDEKRRGFIDWVIRKAAENGVYIEDTE